MAKTELYEAMVVFDVLGDETETKREFDIVQSLIERHSSKFLGRRDWGHKEFAYPIKKKKSGWYVYYLFEAERDVPAKLRHALLMDERVLRHFITRAKPSYAQEFLSKTDNGVSQESPMPVLSQNEESQDNPYLADDFSSDEKGTQNM